MATAPRRETLIALKASRTAHRMATEILLPKPDGATEEKAAVFVEPPTVVIQALPLQHDPSPPMIRLSPRLRIDYGMPTADDYMKLLFTAAALALSAWSLAPL
jgi:hypothetical protein